MNQQYDDGGTNNENGMSEKRKMMEDVKNSEKRLHKSSIQYRIFGMPAELLNELFASLPLENAFGLLAKVPNGLLARNLQKMFKNIKMAMKSNKWNMADCGLKLVISEEGLVVTHIGHEEENSVRAIMPIYFFNLTNIKPHIAFYFEVKIIKKVEDLDIGIGFCSQQFPLEGKWLGIVGIENSIGIWNKHEIWFDGCVDGTGSAYDYFEEGDVVGLGIINSLSANTSKISLFATWNGKLLGKIELPPKFASLQLFPVVNMWDIGYAIRANFGKEEWRFKQFKHVLQ